MYLEIMLHLTKPFSIDKRIESMAYDKLQFCNENRACFLSYIFFLNLPKL